MSIRTDPATILAQLGSGFQILVMLIIAGVALAVASLAGVFRPRSVEGPDRVRSDEQLVPIWIIMFLALTVWTFVPATYAAYKAAHHPPATVAPTTTAATTGPATAPTSQASLLNPRESVLLSIVAFATALVALVGGNLLIRPGGLQRLGFAPALLARAVVPWAIGVVIVIPLMFVAAELTESFWRAIGLQHYDAHPLLRLLEEATGQRGLPALVFISAVIVAPPFEELLFRGHLQTATVYLLHRITTVPLGTLFPSPSEPNSSKLDGSRVLDYFGGSRNSPNASIRWGAIIITSVFFAMVHAELWMMPPLFFLSLCLGYVYERTGNLWVPILLHAAFNAMNVMIFVLNGQ